ncbi:MAG TPA: DUF309 domain-containing protein [Actinomycetes bacterium]|nr:DUF309 domain-containing protein [Actinomycetes bacterium]
MSPSTPRDRDPEGRPRNARPRDAAGRPLPVDADGVTPVDETRERSPEEACHEARRLIDDGRPFAAHEVFEGMWKRADNPGDQALWRGLTQLMVGLTHHQRGNDVGAATLLDRGAESLPAATDVPGIDPAAWATWGRRAAEQVRGGGDPPPPPALGRPAAGP